MRPLIFMLVLLAVVAALSCGRPARGGLKGKAVVAGGGPASGATVNIYDVPEKSSVPPVMTVQVGGDGSFSAGLAPGTYYVAIKMDSAGGGPPYLSKLPPDPVVVKGGVVDVGEMALQQSTGQAKALPGAGLKGRAVKDGAPVTGAVVYLYENTDSGLKGPSYTASGRTGEDGYFSIDAKPGRYYVAVRKRFDESAAGELNPGDLSSDYPGNPVAVKAAGYADIGAVALKQIDPDRLPGLKIGIKEGKGAATMSGRVTDQSGKPLGGMYVLAYDDYRMVGKPRLISEKSGPDGVFNLVLDRPGKYYIGARNSLGGPMEPGDMVGVYEGSPDNSVTVSNGAHLKGADIRLKEVE